MSNLKLDDIVKVIVNLSPKSAVRKGFNLALIIGDSEVIPIEKRVAVYSGLEEMAEAGFTGDMPEYQAAQLYFSADKKPSRLAVGRRYKATGTEEVEGTEEIEEIEEMEKENETMLQALQACRAKNTDWYAVSYCGATKQEILEIAGYVESAYPSCVQFFTTSDRDTLEAEEGNLFELLKQKSYRRSIGQYSQTPDAVAAIMGYAMGANTATINSAYTLKFKTEVGVIPDDLTSQQVTNLTKNNGNYYVSRGSDDAYNMFENGVMSDGTWFDEILNLDMLANNMQMSIMDLLKSRPKIPQTEAGVLSIKLAIKADLDKAVRIGFIAPGVWNGPDILELSQGDSMPEGYMILSEPIAEQSQADRDARMAPPIYTPLKLAGAVHSVVLQVDVNRSRKSIFRNF